MTKSRLGGRAIRTLITNLEVLSGDEQDVMSITRNEDGSVLIRTRKAYEDYWSNNGLRFEIDVADARLLGGLVRGDDQSYNRSAIDEISPSNFHGQKPEEVIEAELREKIAPNCTELDIERAKAENLKEQRANLLLVLVADHSRDLHNPRVDGCPSCETEIRPGHGDGSLPRDSMASYEGAAERAADDEDR